MSDPTNPDGGTQGEREPFTWMSPNANVAPIQQDTLASTQTTAPLGSTFGEPAGRAQEDQRA